MWSYARSATGSSADSPPLERTGAAVYFTCGRASRVRRRGPLKWPYVMPTRLRGQEAPMSDAPAPDPITIETRGNAVIARVGIREGTVTSAKPTTREAVAIYRRHNIGPEKM